MKKRLQNSFPKKFFKRFSISTFIFSLIVLNIFTNNCKTKTGDPASIRRKFTYYINTPDHHSDEAKTALQTTIKEAKSEIFGIFNHFEDNDTVLSILDKNDSGLNLYFAADHSNIGDIGFVKLAEKDISIKTNTIGLMEENFLTADKSYCWISTGGPMASTFSSFSLSFQVHSTALCTDFYNEANQLANGGIFADVGVEEFGDFTHNKGQKDSDNYFTIGSYGISLYFASQERPLNPFITRLLNASKSIRFMLRALTQNQISDENDASKNRDHILNVLEYKNKIKTMFNGDFTVKGVIDDELISDSDDCTAGAIVQSNVLSSHCRLSNLLGSNLKKYTGKPGISFNLFLLDEDTNKPQILLLSSDLRKINTYDLTDAFFIAIEPLGPEADKSIYKDVAAMLDEAYNSSEDF